MQTALTCHDHLQQSKDIIEDIFKDIQNEKILLSKNEFCEPGRSQQEVQQVFDDVVHAITEVIDQQNGPNEENIEPTKSKYKVKNTDNRGIKKLLEDIDRELNENFHEYQFDPSKQ